MHRYLTLLLFLVISGCSVLENPLGRKNHDIQETETQEAVGEELASKIDSPEQKNSEVSEADTSDALQPTEAVAELLVATPEPDDLLSAIAAQLTWETHIDNPKVAREIQRHQKNPHHFTEIMQRSAPFLSLLSETVENRDLPLELVFLPFVESAYDPTAFSPRGAAGLWQFIPSTSTYLGMHTDWWYDERLDIQISTDKALEYLTYLNARFEQNWELALAAYNGGEGHVSSRIKRADGKHDFWSLKLKNETSVYVPKLLAIVEIVKNPERYGVELPEINKNHHLESIVLDKQIDLRLAAQHAEMSYEEFRTINAGFLRWISSPTITTNLLVPADKKQTILASLDSMTTDQQLAWNHYKVQRGDTLIDIARDFGTTMRVIVAINQLENTRIYENQDLLIPKSELSLTRLASESNSVKQLYIVKSGDSLWEISRDQGVPVDQIKRLNNLRSNTIRSGKVLVLAETFVATEITYEVRSGDSLSQIAARFQVAIADILAWNSLDTDLIKPGQELRIRPNS